MELFDFTERTCLLLGGERVARLAASSVLVFGMGGVGSYCVEALARCGVGRLTLVDGDRVERSNLNRQLIALRSTMGMFKCDAARSRILDINPEAHVEIQNVFYTEENAELLDFGEFDYVADAVDMIRAKVLIAERAKHAGRPGNQCDGRGKPAGSVSDYDNGSFPDAGLSACARDAQGAAGQRNFLSESRFLR